MNVPKHSFVPSFEQNFQSFELEVEGQHRATTFDLFILIIFNRFQATGVFKPHFEEPKRSSLELLSRRGETSKKRRVI